MPVLFLLITISLTILFRMFSLELPNYFFPKNPEPAKLVSIFISILAILTIFCFVFGFEFVILFFSFFKPKLSQILYVLFLNSVLFSSEWIILAIENQLPSVLRRLKLFPKKYPLFKMYLICPLVEEIYFRSTFYALFQILGRKSTIEFVFISSFLFGLSHIDHRQIKNTLGLFLMTFGFGIYAGFLMAKMQSFLCCFILHAYCNFMGQPQFKTTNPKFTSLHRQILGTSILMFLFLILKI